MNLKFSNVVLKRDTLFSNGVSIDEHVFYQKESIKYKFYVIMCLCVLVVVLVPMRHVL